MGVDSGSMQVDALETLQCEIQRLKTLNEYKDYELQKKQEKEDFGYEAFSSLRREFDERISEFQNKSHHLEQELYNRNKQLEQIEEDWQQKLEAQKEEYEKTISEMKKEAEKYNKKTTVEWETQI